MAIHIDTVEADLDVSSGAPAGSAGGGRADAADKDVERMRPVVLAILEREIESLLRR